MSDINETIEAVIENEETIGFLDQLRDKWDKFSYKSRVGNWTIKLLSLIIVFASINSAIKFGNAIDGSLFNDLLVLISKYTGELQILPLVTGIVVSLIWFFIPSIGMLLCVGVLYSCFASISPIALILTFFILILFQFEDKPVMAMMIALPVVVLILGFRVEIFIIALASFASTRKNNGVIKTMSFVYLGLLDLCKGYLGPVLDSNGMQVIPYADSNIKVLDVIKGYFTQLSNFNVEDNILGDVSKLLLVFFVVGLIFSKLLNMRCTKRKLKVDILDAIVFAALIAMVFIASTVIKTFTIFSTFEINYQSIIIQIVLVYVLTRVIAGKAPNRGQLGVVEDRKYIFISYSHADFEKVKPYLKLLKKEGYEFWYDDSITAGSEWQGVIASNLANCSCFLAFISTNSIKSDYCLKEINYATSKNKPIAVIMLDDVMLPPVLEMHLASLQAVNRAKFASDDECIKKVFEMDQLKDCKY